MAEEGIPKKRKKRTSGYKIKKFHEIYQSTDEYLGEGACGTVRTFFSLEKRKEFAVKIIRNTSSRVRTKVLKEIEILHHCRGQENIVQMQEFYEEDQNFYLVFEKMEGGTLLDKLTKDGPLPEVEVSKIIRGLANSLKFLHGKAVAHRDVKLENILCTSEANIHPVKLCDFDLSTEFSAMCIGRGESGSEGSTGSPCSSSSSPLHNFASAVGSADYMAPEVVSVWLYESDNYTEQCDLWSLGVVMFILLSGLKPFAVTRKPVKCICPDVADNNNNNNYYQCEFCKEEHFECIKRGRYEMSGPEWSLVSQGAKDLIGKLLVVDPTLRYTPDQVLAHPWIVDPLSFRQQVSAPIPCFSFNKLKMMESLEFESCSNDYDHYGFIISSGYGGYSSGGGSGCGGGYRGNGSRPSSWLSNYCGSEDGDGNDGGSGGYWVFIIDQLDINDHHGSICGDPDCGHLAEQGLEEKSESGAAKKLLQQHQQQHRQCSCGNGGKDKGGVLDYDDERCGVVVDDKNNFFDKIDNNNSGGICCRGDCEDCHNNNNPKKLSFSNRRKKILSQFGSCDSGNMSGVSLLGSPTRF